MSDEYVSKRAQEAAALVDQLEKAYGRSARSVKRKRRARDSAVEGVREAHQELMEAERAISESERETNIICVELFNAREELKEAMRTEQIVAAGDAVDVNAVLDGAL